MTDVLAVPGLDLNLTPVLNLEVPEANSEVYGCRVYWKVDGSETSLSFVSSAHWSGLTDSFVVPLEVLLKI